MLDPAILRALCLFVPIGLVAGAALYRRPDQRELTGALLASIWSLPALLLLHLLAERFGWWWFQADGGLLLGFPVDLYLGWAVLWGAFPVLALNGVPLAGVVAIMVGLDLLYMPACAPLVQLGPTWLVGEAVGVLLGLLPAVLLGRWTAADSHLVARALLQAIGSGGLVLGLVPAIVLEQTGGSWRPLLERPSWLNSLGLQALALPTVLGLSALQEFVERGRGTPVPFDPPRRLVTGGPYAYVRNPMQLAGCLVFAGWGTLLESGWVVAAALVSLAFGLGLAGWDENRDLTRRFGQAWLDYRRSVRAWWPRWRPYSAVDAPGGCPARLYVADGCAMCAEVGRWFRSRRPTGLVVVPAEGYPERNLTRMRYLPANGGPHDEGVAALGRALEHLNLAWAFVGWTLRLPPMCWLAQLLVDALGGGPRKIGHRGQGPTAPSLASREAPGSAPGDAGEVR